jgi:hypothetical protein
MKKKIHNLFHTPKEGQSLVEMAIAVPLLLFLMIGVFEVGWALRGYLVLVNVNREATRYAVRPGYMDFSTEESMALSYSKVLTWTQDSLAAQLKLNFNDLGGNSTLIISHLVVNTGLACEDENDNACDDCSDFRDPDYVEDEAFATDDLILHPKMPGQAYQQKRFGPATGATGYSRASRVNFTEIIENDLIPINNDFNCEMIKRGGSPSSSNAIVTELFYDQPQLFGFPFVSNPFTDPVPLYSHTVMRIVDASRGELTTNIDTLGPICMAYPFTLKERTFVPGTTYDIFDGQSDYGQPQDSRGYLGWFPDGTLSTQTLSDELSFPQLSITTYENALVPGDKSLSVGDYVKSIRGNQAGLIDQIRGLAGQEIVIPVWDVFNGPEDAYHISQFIRVRIRGTTAADIDLNSGGAGNPPFIMATYLGPAENCNQIIN